MSAKAAATKPTKVATPKTIKEKRAVCFFIAPIGKPGDAARKRSDYVFDYVVTPCATARNLEPIRADKIGESGFITTQIISRLIDSEIVVADFWGNNPNVFYELAVRHAFKKPVIHLYFDDLPFDVGQMRAIHVDHQDFPSMLAAQESVGKQIDEALQPGFVQWSPITVALEFDKLQTSGSKTDAVVSGLLTEVDSLKAEMRRMQQQLAVGRQAATVSTPEFEFSGRDAVLGSRLLEMLSIPESPPRLFGRSAIADLSATPHKAVDTPVVEVTIVPEKRPARLGRSPRPKDHPE